MLIHRLARFKSPASDEFRLSEREVLETSLIRSLIASYFTIVRQSIQDLVPKVRIGSRYAVLFVSSPYLQYPSSQAVMHLLVNFSRDGIQARLISRLYKESLFNDLLEEDETTNNERRRVQTLLDTYREAHNSESLRAACCLEPFADIFSLSQSCPKLPSSLRVSPQLHYVRISCRGPKTSNLSLLPCLSRLVSSQQAFLLFASPLSLAVHSLQPFRRRNVPPSFESSGPAVSVLIAVI